MFNILYVIATIVFCFVLISILTDCLCAFNSHVHGNMDGYRVIDYFVDISTDACWKECGRHMSCDHAVYERRYHLCTLLEGPDTPPILKPGFVVASKTSGNIVVSERF